MFNSWGPTLGSLFAMGWKIYLAWQVPVLTVMI